MITKRPADDRGHLDHGWLDARHSFSFGHYFDPHNMGFRSLRVLNEDRIAAGKGFGTHPHDNMEILTWILEGALEHRDSMGHGAVIRPGELQYMSAGTGVRHSEANPSPDAPTHLLQIWIEPSERGLEPRYDQRAFEDHELADRMLLVASGHGEPGAIQIRQDMRLWIGRLGAHTEATVDLAPGRHAWVQVAKGAAEVSAGGNQEVLMAGDAVTISDETQVLLRAIEDSELLLFDLA